MNDYRAYVECDYNSIYHYGVKGTKWGVRRYQYEDGSLTPEGVEHYKQLAAGAAGIIGVGAAAALAEKRRVNLATKLSKSRGTYDKDYKRFMNSRVKYSKILKKASPNDNDFYEFLRDEELGKAKDKYRKAFKKAKKSPKEISKMAKTDVKNLFKSVNTTKKLPKLSKKGKIGLAIGAAALAGAGGYALYKHNKKKKTKEVV